ncbi:DNA topoisomerase III [Coraliomargarita akajimensis]|uniref:DNA topoisomerase n=1 Tax=Coraliomargarita akajimensis (strain DSM 45221 / IAM 15411 / JCM 23193 / KCTC 12865 / 04OKA010-24) TaxID=583355 RepID=D5ELQ9_CORAD|nr:DNA topoisomerase III [Coraliomargarita akajimensis]ADE53234.1 DNA topoisomerase III [Coraliomargarita akajimensis DSM 45221]
MKYLIIAEKPSVATDLSRALAKSLGKFEKKGKSRDAQFFDNENASITSAVGHLVELKMPKGPNGKNLPWNFNVLPAIPKHFDLQPIEQSASRLKHVLALAKKKDYDVIVNACDAGREGELIFQYIMEIGKITKPSKRMWMQSMTTGAIQEAWGALREGDEMKHLADAAKCRSESDWLVGLNSTRAMTCFRSRHGGFNITAAGRVQTPTLAILAKREREIKAFNPEDYWEVHGDFGVEKGNYEGRWFNPDFKKDETKPHGKAERIWDKEVAESIRERCTGKTGTVTEETKPSKQIAPQLYDLTTLQREAPFTAKNTLAITQALYERHKMVTYPRTDSRYLPEDYIAKVKETTRELANSNHPVAQWAAKSLEGDQIQFNKRVFNNAKVSDHFAIIPTGRMVKLSEQEAKVYDMIVKRFIAVFFPQAEFENTKRITTIDHGAEKDQFLTQGKTLVNPGWMAVYGRVAGVAAGKDELVAVNPGETAKVDAIRVEDKQTKPPARFTESTLLSAMEGAGKLVDDDELREAMSERGLGTPATRAAIIEGLLRQKYIARDGRDLNVTGKGLRLIELCEEMKIEALTSPSMTGDWEAKLNKMQHGEFGRAEFMKEIVGFTEDVVAKAKSHMDAMVNRVFPDLETACPNCGAPRLKQTDATYECRDVDCDFKVSKHIAGRRLSDDEAIKLFTEKELPELEGFRSRFNKPFSAGLKLARTVSKTGKIGKWKIDFVFDEELEPSEDLRDDQIIKELALPDGTAAKLYATEKAYHLPQLKTKDAPEGFRLGKTILQRELQPAEVESLFATGKTPLIEGFISKRTKRPFKAFLTLDFDSGKIGFEFAPRGNAKKDEKKES